MTTGRRFESFYLKVSQFGLDEWTLAARCCEDCCAAQDVECTSTGEGSSSTWYWDGCDCTQFPVCNVPCTGDDCDEMFSSESNCANAYLSCVDIC